MIAFRDATAARLGLELIVHTNQEGLARGINPIASGSALHTAGDEDRGAEAGARPATASTPRSAARGATRRRAGPRSGSSRSAAPATSGTRATSGRNSGSSSTPGCAPGESMRVFPLSNWTELDVWEYIAAEKIDDRAALFRQASGRWSTRGGVWIMVDDDRLPLEPGETPEMRRVRFRTLGCYPLTGAIEFDGADRRRHRRRAAQRATLRAAGPADRQRRGRLDGAQEARGLFLMPDVATASRGGRQEPAAVPDLRLGR